MPKIVRLKLYKGNVDSCQCLARRQAARLQAMLLASLYALGFLILMWHRHLDRWGAIGKALLAGRQNERRNGHASQFSACDVGHNGSLPALVLAFLACAGAGALARGVADQKPVLQFHGLL